MTGPDAQKIRLLLADSQSLFREAVRAVLADGGEIDVVAEAGDGRGALGEAVRHEPDVAIVDSDLPNGDGISTTRAIRQNVPSCSVIFLAPGDAPAIVLAAVEAGATAFLTRETPLRGLVEATRAVCRGEAYIPPHLLRELLSRLVERRQDRDLALRRLGRLTRREREVLALLAKGADNDRIALALVISPETARTHVQNLLGKLEVHSRLEAAAFVAQRGLLEELEPVESLRPPIHSVGSASDA
jgi:DNA-binding NarL/FixJ family response regulator